MRRSSSPKRPYNNFVSGKLSVQFVISFCTFFLIFIHTSLCQSNWTPLNSPGGGNINTIFKVSDSIFLAGLQHGSIFRSSDSGANWIQVHSAWHNTNNEGVDCFTFNANQEVLVGTYVNGIMRSTDFGLTWINTNCGGGEHIVNTESGYMLSADNVNSTWRFAESLDSGKTWSSIPYPFGTQKIFSMRNYFDIIFVGLPNTIRFSSDFGETWLNYGNQLSSGNIYDILILSIDEILVGSANGIFYTSDHGLTWELRNNGIPSNRKKINQIQNHSDTIYACGTAGLLYSTNLGNQWIHYNNYHFQLTINSIVIPGISFFAATNTAIYEIRPANWINSSYGIYSLSPSSISSTANNDLIYNVTSGLFKSSDGGENWNVLELENFYLGRTFVHKNNLYFVQTTDSLFYLSTDYGNMWINTGSFWGYTTGISFSKDNNNIYSGFYRYIPSWPNPPGTGIRYSTNFGETWLWIPHVDGWNRFTKVVTIPGNLLFTDVYDFMGGGNLGLYRRTNPSGQWIETNSGLPSKSNKYLASDKTYDLYVSQNSGIYKLDRSDYVWHLYAGGNLDKVEYISFNTHNNIVVVNDGKIYASANGKNWDYASTGLDDKIIKIVEQHSDGHYFASDNSGRLYKTLTPYLINQLPSMPELVSPINNQQVVPDTINFLWKSSRPLVMQYLFELSNDSLFNSFLDTLLTDTSLTILDLDFGQNYYWRVKAFNEVGWGSYSDVGTFTTNPTSAKNEVDENLFEFSLQQNFPNPFNPTTIIKFIIPQADNPLPGGARGGFVTLKVYDVLGNEITTLVNKEKPAGEYEVEFDGSDLSSGIYFYQLKAGSFVITKKMVLMR
jgi:photosystem II stability/assembly factor-like uncharacterized protein